MGFRKPFDCDINDMIANVTEHVEEGVYMDVSMNATAHMLVVVCACERLQAEFPENIWHEPESRAS